MRLNSLVLIVVLVLCLPEHAFATNNAGDFGSGNGGIAVGSGYANTVNAPTNGAIIQGNVGIGTSAPISNLDLNGNGADLSIGSVGCTSGYLGLSVNGINCVNYGFLLSTTDSFINHKIGGGIHFREGNGTDQVTIQAGGNVGIGTMTPPNLLSVVSSVSNNSQTLVSILQPSLPYSFASSMLLGKSNTNGNSAIVSFTSETPLSTSYASYGIVGSPNAINVAPSGNVGIGTTSPLNALDVNGGVHFVDLGGNPPPQAPYSLYDAVGILWFNAHPIPILNPTPANANTLAFFATQTQLTSAPNITVTNQGYLGLGMGPSYILDVSGSMRAGSYLTGSDKRFKENITNLDGSLAKVTKMQGVSFLWKNDQFSGMHFDERKHIGLIAQDLELIAPEVVSTDRNGFKNIAYSELIPLMIESLKEVNQKIELQNVEIENLKREIVQLNKNSH